MKVLNWTFAATVVVAAGWFGRTIPFAEQWTLYQGLCITSALIFVSIAERLKHFDGRPSDSGVRQLVTPLVYSALILGAVLIIGVIAPIAKRYVAPLNVEWFRGIAYGVLVALTIAQIRLFFPIVSLKVK